MTDHEQTDPTEFGLRRRRGVLPRLGVGALVLLSGTVFLTGRVANRAAAQRAVTLAWQTPGVKQWSSSQSTAAIGDFVSLMMGLTTSDPRTAPATTLLQQHYQSAVQESGVTPTEALQSTFITACMAPTFVSIGM